VECARTWLVRMGSRRLPFFVLSDEFGSLGTNTDCDLNWGTPLGVVIVVVTNIFSRVDY